MKTLLLTCLSIPLAVAFFGDRESSQDSAPSPHEWLQQLAGHWSVDGDGVEVTETGREIGEFWVVSEGTVQMGERRFSYQRTLGYDTTAKAFVGTWIDANSSYLWLYGECSLDVESNTLTLDGVGPGFDGKESLFRETIRFEGPDRRVHENLVQEKDGSWTSFETSVYVRG